MPTYALPVLDENGGKLFVPLVAGTLGYPHVVLYDEAGTAFEIPNVPPQDPPTGMFPVRDENGVEYLIAFEVVDSSGNGPPVPLIAVVGPRITHRWRNMQLGDHSRIEFDMIDLEGPVNLNTASVLEVKCRRSDLTILTRTATFTVPPGGTVANRLIAQLQAGDVQSFGEWLMQARIVLADGSELRSEVRRVMVQPNV